MGKRKKEKKVLAKDFLIWYSMYLSTRQVLMGTGLEPKLLKRNLKKLLTALSKSAMI
jgi:hypothetical protein